MLKHQLDKLVDIFEKMHHEVVDFFLSLSRLRVVTRLKSVASFRESKSRTRFIVFRNSDRLCQKSFFESYSNHRTKYFLSLRSVRLVSQAWLYKAAV